MKKLFSRTLTLSLALILLCASLSSCAVSLTMDKTNGNLYDKKNDITYLYAPGTYEPVSIGDKYAVWGEFDMTFYKINGLEPEKWLCDTGKTVLYSSSEKLPTLDEMNVTSVLLCNESELTYSFAEITDKVLIALIIGLYNTSESVEYPAKAAESNVRMKFVSEEYPGIYYNLNFYKYSDGSAYIYDRYSKKCIVAGSLLDEYLD